MIVRALRLRAIFLGLPMRIDAFSDSYELYGRTSYLQVLAFCNSSWGRAIGAHLFNILYVAGGIILHRMFGTRMARCRPSRASRFCCFSSMLLWSTAALKESFNFFIVVSTLGATVLVLPRARAMASRRRARHRRRPCRVAVPPRRRARDCARGSHRGIGGHPGDAAPEAARRRSGADILATGVALAHREPRRLPCRSCEARR